MTGVRFGKCVALVACAVGVPALVLMWGEAGLPPAGRPLRLFGASGRAGVFGNPYPESLIVFVALMWATTFASLLGFGDRDESTPEWTWGPALVLIGGLSLAMVWQARRVNGVPVEVVQTGYCLAVATGSGLVGAGLVCLAPARRRAYREVPGRR